MKILLLGKGGQVGWELQRSLAPLGELVALDHDSTDFCGDFNRPEALAQTVRALEPQLIVNAAAHTAVDQAESEPGLARLINATAPGVLAREAERLGAWLVHYSTYYVFDGSGSRPWVEGDAPAPLSVYGQTKLEGEQAIQAACSRHLILRTSWVYAARGNNFAKTMLRLAQEREQLTVIDDQIGAPTGADLLADVTALALREVRERPQLAGLYHLSAGGETSWNGYARHVIDQARRIRPEQALKVREIRPVPSSAFQAAAKRPHNSRLNTARLQAAFGLCLPPWQQGVNRMLAEIL
jgi:dTDP-4-dehydrorhamnose reductase